MKNPVTQTVASIIAATLSPSDLLNSDGYMPEALARKLNMANLPMYPDNPLRNVKQTSLIGIGGEHEEFTFQPLAVGIAVPEESVFFPASNDFIVECPWQEFAGYYHDMQSCYYLPLEWDLEPKIEAALTRFHGLLEQAETNNRITRPALDFSAYLRPFRYSQL